MSQTKRTTNKTTVSPGAEKAAVKLYRKRFIPAETVLLNDDIVLLNEPDALITKWETLRPKREFKYGFSCYRPRESYKISKVYDEARVFKFAYIDIISAETDSRENVYVFTDMLVDIKIEPNGFVTVLDLNELAAAYESGFISITALLSALNAADRLLKIVYAGGLSRLTEKLDKFISGM